MREGSTYALLCFKYSPVSATHSGEVVFGNLSVYREMYVTSSM